MNKYKIANVTIDPKEIEVNVGLKLQGGHVFLIVDGKAIAFLSDEGTLGRCRIYDYRPVCIKFDGDMIAYYE